jgi:hypothetical protein
MGLPVRFFAAIAASTLLLATPAEAKLGEPIATFTRSKLIQGDSLFHFEGRFGARYRFAGARRCRFGQGMLAVDVDNNRIVQQIVILPLPTTSAEEKTIREVAAMFIDDLGLDVTDKERARVMDAFLDTLLSGKKVEQPVGTAYDMRVYCQPQLRTIMMVVALKGEEGKQP